MANRKKENIGQCVYCGQIQPLTKDHIPPKNLFPGPRPHNLIAVPSCWPCNKGASLDDEYLRLVISLREDMDESSAAVCARQVAMRGLRRLNARGFRKAFLANIRRAELVTPSGLYLRDVGVYEVNAARLNQVATRTIRGLFYHEKGYRLPEQYEAVTLAGSEFANSPHKITQAVELASYMRSRPFRTIGEGTFSYKYQVADDDENATAWLLIFYERFTFMGLTVPKDEDGRT